MKKLLAAATVCLFSAPVNAAAITGPENYTVGAMSAAICGYLEGKVTSKRAAEIVYDVLNDEGINPGLMLRDDLMAEAAQYARLKCPSAFPRYSSPTPALWN